MEAKEEAANNVIIPDLKALKLYIYIVHASLITGHAMMRIIYVTLILTIEEHVGGDSITQVSLDRPLMPLPLPPQ